MSDHASPHPPMNARASAAEIESARLAADRLAAVHATGLLDAPPSAALDRFTRIAASLLDVPAAFISLVDADRDFYASHCGFGEPLASARELRGPTFCHHALLAERDLVIDDTRADPLYRLVPTVESLGVAAYIGVPLRAPGGEVVGSFCAIDFKPRRWTERERQVMEELAASALREMQLAATLGEQARLADEALAARRAAEEATAARREMLNAVSHDLRDPLNAITLALGALDAQPLDEGVARGVAVVRRQTARMKRLLEHLLEAARIDSGAMSLDFHAVEVAPLLAEIAADFALQAEAAGVALAVDGGPPGASIRADRARLIAALANLVSNALKFTPHGGRIDLSARTDGPWVRVAVTDTGCGIDGDCLGKVFEPFWQASPAERKGSGLGLHIVRGIVEAHGGQVSVRSAPGRGTTFEVALPDPVPR